MVTGLHLPYLPLAIMLMNLPVNEIPLVFSYTKSPNRVASVGKKKIKKKNGLQDPYARNSNATNFVHGCEPYLRYDSPLFQ